MISATVFTPCSPPPTDRSNDGVDQPERLSRRRRNVGEPAKYWPQNSTIKIAMYDYPMDDPYVLAVKNAASEWSTHINLTFEFVSGDEGDVRITQNIVGDAGGSSRIGNDAQRALYGAPTMSLPIDHTLPSFNQTVLHEFGHMLGAHHAHQHPDANIQWNQSVLDMNYPQTYQQTNFLPLPRSESYDFLPYDPDSIMHYAIDPGLTTSNVYHSGGSTLSAGDIAWAKKTYPRPDKGEDATFSIPGSPHSYQAPPMPPAIHRPRFRDADSDCITQGVAHAGL